MILMFTALVLAVILVFMLILLWLVWDGDDQYPHYSDEVWPTEEEIRAQKREEAKLRLKKKRKMKTMKEKRGARRK